MNCQLLTLLLSVLIASLGTLANDDDQLPFLTNTEENGTQNENLLIISTMDGKISAFKSSDGSMVWSINTDPGGLISSSLSKLVGMFHGQEVLLVPSLDGNLYKFDGKMLEPLPVSAEMMLSTSYKVGDNLNILGGREMRSYGISLHTGELRYLCTHDGCEQYSSVSESEDILIVDRLSQTVRAVNSRNGDHQWNYKVGEHRVTVSKGMKIDMNKSSKVISMKTDASSDDEHDLSVSDDIVVAMLKGFIGTVNEDDITYKWTQKLDSPIVDVWKLQGDSMVKLDLFEKAGFEKDDDPSHSLLVLGVYKKKLYIKQSPRSERETSLEKAKQSYVDTIPFWMPIVPEEKPRQIIRESDRTSVSHKHSGHAFENGVFFYENNPSVSNTTHCYAEKGSKLLSIKQSFISLAIKWKELVAISFVLSILLNVIHSYVLRRYFKRNVCQTPVPILPENKPNDLLENKPEMEDEGKKQPFSLQEQEGVPEENQNLPEQRPETLIRPLLNPIAHNQEEVPEQNRENLPAQNQQVLPTQNQAQTALETPSAIFQSRFANDFRTIERLGKGGYGVVFEVENKIDCCRYAVKRIKYSKNRNLGRVVREVVILAQLDHGGIVRYYNGWTETPPVDFEDPLFDDSGSTVESSSVCSGTSLAARAAFINPLRPFDDDLLSPDFDGAQKIQSSCSSSTRVSFRNVPDGEHRASGGDIVSKHSAKKSPKPFGLLYIQMQLCRKESLKDWLRINCGKRNIPEVLDIFYQIVDAVEYVHGKGMMHRDLKPSNIFFSLDGFVKIGDFGLVSYENSDENLDDVEATTSERPPRKHTEDVGTELYMSPEMIEGLNYNSKIDIFSLGLILYELLVPFTTQYERVKALTDIRTGKFPRGFRNSYVCEYDLVSWMLQKKPDDRPSAAKIKKHPVFNVICDRNVMKKTRSRTVSTASKHSSNEDSDE